MLAIAAMAMLAACGSENDQPGAGSSPAASGSEAGRGVLPPTPTTVPLFTDTGLADPLDAVPETQLIGITGWINSDPLDIEQLTADGKVVLIDFWTYTCVNCVRTFPFLRTMHSRYGPLGLTVIGVHSPEFEFEKDALNVATAVEAADLRYAVAIDSDKLTWSAYGNHFWPTTYLVGADGEVVYRHFGEGGYEDTEARIREALQSAGVDLSDVPSGGNFSPPVAEHAVTQTRELYAGYGQGYESAGLFAAQDEYYLGADRVVEYRDQGLRRHGQFELAGNWLNEIDSVSSVGGGGYIVFPFFATSVNVILRSDERPATVVVELDGKPVPGSHAGPDIQFDGDGRSVMVVDEPRLYRAIESDEFRRYELKITVESEGLKIHSFTFGVFSEGP